MSLLGCICYLVDIEILLGGTLFNFHGIENNVPLFPAIVLIGGCVTLYVVLFLVAHDDNLTWVDY